MSLVKDVNLRGFEKDALGSSLCSDLQHVVGLQQTLLNIISRCRKRGSERLSDAPDFMY